MKRTATVFLILTLLGACKEEPAENNSGSPDDLIEIPLEFDTLIVQKEWGDCSGSEEGCMTVTLEYPEIRQPDSIGKLLNTRILSMLLGEYRDSFSSAEAYAGFLLNEYEKQAAGSPSYPGAQVEKVQSVVYARNQLLGLRLEVLENAGGARAQNRLVLQSWSQKDARRIFLDDVFQGTYRDTLTKLARYHLGQAMQINLEAVEGNKSGFSADGFRLNEQFLLDDNGISFLYDQQLPGTGEGIIEFTIPYSELIEYNLINEDGPLGFLLGSVNL